MKPVKKLMEITMGAAIEMKSDDYLAAYAPLNEITDKNKYRNLVKTINVYGWLSYPIFYYAGVALCGSHRYFAIETLNKIKTINIPVTNIADVCDDLFGISEDVIKEWIEEDCDETYGNYNYSLAECICQRLQRIDYNLCFELGLDAGGL